MIFFCRGDFCDALATNLDGDAITQDDNVEVIGIVVAFAYGGDFVAHGVMLLDRLLFHYRERCRVVEEFFEDFSAAMALALHECGLLAVSDLFFEQAFYYAASGCSMRDAVDENQFAEGLVIFKEVCDNSFCKENLDDGDSVLV